MENKMKEVAKLLGVELGEEFKLDDGNIIYKLSDSGLIYYDNDKFKWCHCHSNILELLLLGYYRIDKEILNCSEREYLSNVIKPFRYEVVSIKKLADNFGNYYRIAIKKLSMASYISDETIYLPYFKGGTMYNTMKIDKEYTLKELGL